MIKSDRDKFLECLQLAIQTIANRNDLIDPDIDFVEELNDPNGEPGWFNSGATENRFMAITDNVEIILKAIKVAHFLTTNDPLPEYVDKNLKYVFGD